MTDLHQSEYEALRATIRERGTVRFCALLAGLTAWGALVMAWLIAGLHGGVTLVPLLILAATFEINFFVHTGVERIGRYIQVFYEESSGSTGWETTAMSYGSKYPGGLDPLFVTIFLISASVNFLNSLATGTRGAGWIALSLVAHLVFAYRIVTARKLASTQRALDLDRYRSLISK